MVHRKRLLALLTISTIGMSSLAGCTSNQGTTGSNNSGKEADPYNVLANKNARIAINMAIDKQELCDVILNNGSVPADYFVPNELAINKDGKDYRDVAGKMGYSYNGEEAKKYWDKAKEEVGFGTVTLELVTFDSDTSKRQAEFMQSELQENLPGLTIKIKTQPFKQKIELEQKGKFQLAYAGWGADYPDPLTFLDTMMKGVSYASNTGYKSDEYNKLVNEAKAMPEQNESWKKFAEAEKLMLEDAYIAPLIQSGMAYMQKEYVSDMFKFPTVPWSYKWADVDKEKKQLNLISTSDIPTIDPSKATDTVSFEVMTNTMEGLVRIDKENKAIPGIAESWQTSEDGLTWTFKLRKDAKWSNGDEVTAKDFEYSWKRTLNPETASQYGFIMHDIVGAKEYNLGENKDPDSVGVKAIDDYTLEVKLVRPVTYFDKLMAFGVYLPQNQKFVESQGDTFGTTAKSTLYNGPFTLSEWKIEDHYSMTKNPTYWDNSAVKLDEINTKIVKDANSALNLYETDAIDRVGVTSENVDKYKDSKEFKTMKDSSTYFLQINAGNPQK